MNPPGSLLRTRRREAHDFLTVGSRPGGGQMSQTLIQGLRAFGRSATYSAQKPRRRTGRLLTVAAGAVLASSVFVLSADAAPTT
jgi:hypothetical protein